MNRGVILALLTSAGLAACSSTSERGGTLAELKRVSADTDEVLLADSLDRAAESYRRYLAETERNPRTPEAMRRLADLQLAGISAAARTWKWRRRKRPTERP
jgi:hypothetical protein